MAVGKTQSTLSMCYCALYCAWGTLSSRLEFTLENTCKSHIFGYWKKEILVKSYLTKIGNWVTSFCSVNTVYALQNKKTANEKSWDGKCVQIKKKSSGVAVKLSVRRSRANGDAAACQEGMFRKRPPCLNPSDRCPASQKMGIDSERNPASHVADPDFHISPHGQNPRNVILKGKPDSICAVHSGADSWKNEIWTGDNFLRWKTFSDSELTLQNVRQISILRDYQNNFWPEGSF